MGWRAACVGMVLAAMGMSRAQGAGLDATTLPEDTKWVLHVDVDRAKDTGIWQNLQRRLNTLEGRRECGRQSGDGGVDGGAVADCQSGAGVGDHVAGGIARCDAVWGCVCVGGIVHPASCGDERSACGSGAARGMTGFGKEDYSGSVILSWGKAAAGGGRGRRIMRGFRGRDS